MEETSTPNRKTLEHELIIGRDCTKKLQNLLHRKDVDEDLVMQIIGSFSKTLSMCSSSGTYVGSGERETVKDRRLITDQLIKGRDCTKQLQNLLHRPRVVDGGPVSTEDLVMQIIGSFSDSLSTFSSWRTCLCPDPTTTYVGSANHASSSRERGKKPVAAMKDRRGCYKRRNTEYPTVTTADTYEDGYAWRKYGQKKIQYAKFPRCYYRCTHKDEGCGALKHVQELEDGSEMFRITYFGSHTCQNVNKNSQLLSYPDDNSFLLINFEDSRITHSPNSLSIITNVQTTPSINQENDSKAQSGDYLVANSHDPSSYV